MFRSAFRRNPPYDQKGLLSLFYISEVLFSILHGFSLDPYGNRTHVIRKDHTKKHLQILPLQSKIQAVAVKQEVLHSHDHISFLVSPWFRCAADNNDLLK